MLSNKLHLINIISSFFLQGSFFLAAKADEACRPNDLGNFKLNVFLTKLLSPSCEAEYLHFKATVTLPKVSQKALYYGWIPLIMYVGLNLGTHKYATEENPMQQKERQATVLDCIPIIGTAGLP